MFERVINFLKPQPVEHIVAEMDSESLSVAEGVFANICSNAVDGGHSKARVVDDLGRQLTLVQYDLGSGWKDVGELPIELGFLKRTRMVANSRGVADSRVPRDYATVDFGFPRVTRRFEVHIMDDQHHPAEMLEFRISELDVR